MKGVFKWSPIVRAYGKRLFILAISCLPLLVYSCAQASDKDSLFVRRDGYWEDRREEVYNSSSARCTASSSWCPVRSI